MSTTEKIPFSEPARTHYVETPHFEQTYSASDLDEFHLDVPFTHLSIRETDTKEINVRMQGAGTHPQLLPQVRTVGKALQVYQHFVPALQTLWEDKAICVIEVSVPKGFRTSVLLIAGSVFLDHTSGAISLELKRGSICGTHLGPSIDAKVFIGSVAIHQLHGSSHVWVGTGQIEMAWEQLSESGQIDIVCGAGDLAVKFPKEQEVKAISHAGFFRKTQIRSQGGALISATVGVGNLWIA